MKKVNRSERTGHKAVGLQRLRHACQVAAKSETHAAHPSLSGCVFLCVRGGQYALIEDPH